jgi:hypothetical protein
MSEMVTEESQAATSAGAALDQMIWGFAVSPAVYVTAKLGIVDVLSDGPKSSPEIASAVGAHEPALHRLLRALTSANILVEDANGRFAATAEGDLLRSDHSRSARRSAIFLGSPFMWRPWGALDEAIVAGTPTFDRIFGEAYYAYLARNAEDRAVFNAAMTSGSGAAVPSIVAAYDFSGFTRIVDVGGGEGALLRGILERCPHATGVLYDLPPVVAGADALRELALAARCEIIGGDMFQTVPSGGDAYVLRGVIHNWGDREAVQILRRCREAMSDEGTLLLVEFVLAPSNAPDVATRAWNAAWVDLTMLDRSGAERSGVPGPLCSGGFQAELSHPGGRGRPHRRCPGVMQTHAESRPDLEIVFDLAHTAFT